MTTVRTQDGYKHMYDCFMCSRSFQFGPHIYDGKAIGAWGIQVCSICYESNHDGIVCEQHPRLVRHLKERGVDMTVNQKGWLPWPR